MSGFSLYLREQLKKQGNIRLREYVGCAIPGKADKVLSVLGVIIHVWTMILAFKIKGFYAAFMTFFFPVLSQIFWFFKIGAKVGYTKSWFCISLMVYAILWVLVLLGFLAAQGRSDEV